MTILLKIQTTKVKKQRTPKADLAMGVLGGHRRIRTFGRSIKSRMLYQLSYVPSLLPVELEAIKLLFSAVGEAEHSGEKRIGQQRI